MTQHKFQCILGPVNVSFKHLMIFLEDTEPSSIYPSVWSVYQGLTPVLHPDRALVEVCVQNLRLYITLNTVAVY